MLVYSQHGFIGDRLTVTNLASFSQCATSMLLSGLLHTYFAKKIAKLGRKVATVWFTMTRKQLFVSYSRHILHRYAETSGVPHRSTLGPLMFLLSMY